MFKKEVKNKLKNEGFYVATCILMSIIIPFTAFLLKKESKKTEYITINVLDSENNKIKKMKLEDYILGVLRQEVPASYEKEALKAQAVAIRSYTLRKKETKAHENADVCTSFVHCMAYMSEADAMKKWGKKFNELNSIYKNAVKETKNQVLKYNEEIANTVFFAISSGKTENSADVWGGNVPYLISVDSNEDKNATGFESVKEVTINEFKEKLGVGRTVVNSTERSEGGAVKNITVDGKEFKGSEIRSVFSLRSANFEIEIKDKITFKVKGYGHGVGMSQNGANECAKKGMNYKEILYKYYNGTTLIDLFSK